VKSLAHTFRSRRTLAPRLTTLAAALLVTACRSDSVLAPSGGAVDAVRLAASSRQLTSLGDTLRLDALVRDAAGERLNAVPMQWQLSSTGVLEPLGNGLFRAVGNGRVTIVGAVDPSATGVRPRGYYADLVTDSIVVDVEQRPAQVLTLSADTLFTMVGLARPVRLRITDARGYEVDPALLRVSYQVLDPHVATVDSTGMVRSASEGRTELVATAGTATGSTTWRAPITVRPRAAHTSCMTFTQRRRARQACVTSDFVVHAPRGGTP
jgi:hypothetical protein